MNRIDFLASQPHYLDHIAPIWDALPDPLRGTFYVPLELLPYAKSRIENYLYLFQYTPASFGPFVDAHPVLVAGYGDMLAAHRQNPSKRILMMEHGTGHTFHTVAYPDGPGKRDVVSMFLPPNQYTLQKIKSVRNTRCEVVGTPKLDKIVWEINPLLMVKASRPTPPTIAIGFHWGTRRNRPPESGSAWEHYKSIIPELQKEFQLLAYGHPLAEENHKNYYEELGIPYTRNFLEVMRRADVCVNDLSSVMYEFLTTGKPVVVLNAPWFRRDVHHGIRFWDYSDIGINVEQPEDLSAAIHQTLDNYSTIHLREREKAVRDLFPYLGQASKRAVAIIQEYLNVL